MVSSANIQLNFQRPNVAAIVYAAQNDKLTRKVVALLMDGAVAWTPPAGVLTVVRYSKPDGTTGFYDTDENGDPAVVISGSTATITLAEQVLTVPGDVPVQLNFYTSGGEKLSTLTFIVRVQKSPIPDEDIVSTDYYNILTAEIASVLEAQEALLGLTATAYTGDPWAGASVNVTGGGSTPYNFEFVIPRGKGTYLYTTIAAGNTSATANFIKPEGYYPELEVVCYDIDPNAKTQNLRRIAESEYTVGIGGGLGTGNTFCTLYVYLNSARSYDTLVVYFGNIKESVM